MEGRPLDHLELLSIAKKDEDYYRNWLGDDIQEIAQRCLGVRRWIKFRNAITVLTRLGYFTISKLSNNRSPGEEFCDAQTTNPSFLKNLLMTVLNNDLRIPKEIPRLYSNLVLGVHNVTFFIFGDFYELAKRITNYTYVTTDNSTYETENLRYLYKFIGCGMIVKLMFNVIKYSQLIEDGQDSSEKSISPKEMIVDNSPRKKKLDPTTTCHLCSEARKEATSTLCGHIFCWDCIHKWLKDRRECPICRTPTEPSRLIHLINYK